MNKEQELKKLLKENYLVVEKLRELLKENYLLIESKVFEKLSYEIVFNPYTDRTVVFYTVLDEENDINLVDILTWYWGDTYRFDEGPISIEALDKIFKDKEYALIQFLVRKEEK